MKIIKVNLDNPKEKVIQEAALVLQNGGLIVYPTDTAYGLGGNALDKKVVLKVYEAKGRNLSKPTHVIVRDWKMIDDLTKTNVYAKKLFQTLMPGPLTIVLPKKAFVPDLLTANLPTLGFRLPDCEITKRISALIDFPYTTPSANKSGGKTPYSIHGVLDELSAKKIDLALDAGPLKKNIPSTIIDLTMKPPKIVREGPITKKQLEEVLEVKIV